MVDLLTPKGKDQEIDDLVNYATFISEEIERLKTNKSAKFLDSLIKNIADFSMEALAYVPTLLENKK